MSCLPIVGLVKTCLYFGSGDSTAKLVEARGGGGRERESESPWFWELGIPPAISLNLSSITSKRNVAVQQRICWVV